MKRNLMLAVVLTGIILPAGYLGAVHASFAPAKADDIGALVEETRRVMQGYAIAPVPLNVAGKDQVLVGLGSYIVNAQGGCSDCHTNPPYAPGGDPFNGEPEKINTEHYLAGGVEFGPFRSRNLTPNLQTGRPANLTFEQFLETMRTGKDQKNRHPQISPLLQVMPWPTYGKMSDRDLRAIYEYLSAIPHADPPPAP